MSSNQWLAAAPPAGALHAARLDSLGAGALEAVIHGMAALRALLPDAVRIKVDPDLVGFWNPATRPVVDRLRALASCLVRDTIKGSGPDLQRAYHELAPVLNALPLESKDVEPHLEEGGRGAGRLLRDIGYQEHNATVEFVGAPGGGIAGAWTPVSPRVADVHLIQSLCDTMFAWAARDPLLEVETAAGQWAFRGFAGPREAGPPAVAAARMCRELEWLTADRLTLAFGTPVARAFLARTRRTEPSPRLRALARLVAQSLVGAFRVRTRRGAVAVFEDLAGERFDVVEHNERLVYGPTDWGFGRLIPTGSGRWFRSQGFVLYRPPAAGAGRALAELVDRFSAEGLDPGLAVEGAIHVLDGAPVVPDHQDPAASAEEAQQLFELFWQRVRAVDAGRVLAGDELPAEARPLAAAGEVEARRLPMDSALTLWVMALDRQAAPYRDATERRSEPHS